MALQKNEFYVKVRSSFDHVQLYEQAVLQQQALSSMPVEKLQQRAESKAKDLGLGKEHLRDLLIIELLDWFKNCFFKWVDTPECSREGCKGKKTTFIGMTSPINDEALYQANRVEKYECVNCKETVRFPRYNHPGRLLQVRRGRCGEWANCFTLLCRALNYDARYVLDWTDHVWTEVYSDNQKRWLHCDPCENACDKPLLYESGWGKELTYVLAFSRDDIQDVTWRYSAKHGDVLRRRNQVSEPWLVGLIFMLRNERQFTLDPQRRQFLLERTVQELVEMMNPRSSTEEEAVGRQTGSLEWRMARGELGKSFSHPALHYTIVPTEKEISRNTIQLKYSCAKDLYIRGDEKIAEWVTLLFEAKNMVRKVEYDWNMVYLARVEDSPDAFISWKFDLSSCSKSFNTCEIEVHSACFATGQILWELSDNNGRTLKISSEKRHTLTELCDSKVLLLKATLTQGSGHLAWQHTQLFRQKRFPKSGEDLEWPFSLILSLK